MPSRIRYLPTSNLGAQQAIADEGLAHEWRVCACLIFRIADTLRTVCVQRAVPEAEPGDRNLLPGLDPAVLPLQRHLPLPLP